MAVIDSCRRFATFQLSYLAKMLCFDVLSEDGKLSRNTTAKVFNEETVGRKIRGF